VRIKCNNLVPNEKQAKQLGDYYYPGKQDFYLNLGREYVVFGIRILNGMPWVDLVSDTNYLFPAPLCLFEITDGRVSQYWETRVSKDGNLLIWPRSFYREYYHDDLLEGVQDVVEDFERVRAMIEAEN
jgi:hypothetical protein